MAFDVFISYSSKNVAVANAACAAVEAAGPRCWMAPRNIRPGRTYGEAIIDGMNDCRILVLIFSAYSNASPQVLREAERAVSKGLEIITIRVDDVPMSMALEYFLGATHWLDGVGDIDAALGRLGGAVCEGLGQPLPSTPSPAKGGDEDASPRPPSPQSWGDRTDEPSPSPSLKSFGTSPQPSPWKGEGARGESEPTPNSSLKGRESSPLRRVSNVPAGVTSFVGREEEKAGVEEALGRGRMVTVTGPGGCGKTRVALEVAGEVVEGFSGGVWYVDLAEEESSNVGADVLRSLRLTEEAGTDAISTVCADLAAKSALLVLDNCEHVVDDVRRLSKAVLRQCPEVKILATSRSGVGVAGETMWPLTPFAAVDMRKLPRGGPALVEAVAGSDAVKLFVDRARSISPAFALTERNAADIAHICNRLDGVPLAIELAASRVKVLTPEQISARLDDQFRLLGGNKSAHARHQTLRATLDWSYDLLAENEKALLRRLSIFEGPCGVDAVEAVCAGDPIEDWEILDLLTNLVDRSLLTSEEWEGGYRYGMLTSVREYAAEKESASPLSPNPSPLQGKGDRYLGEHELRRRHRDWYLREVEEADTNLTGTYQAAWLDRIEADRPNWLASLAYSVDQGDVDEALRFAAAASRYWTLRCCFAEASTWLDRVIDLAHASDAKVNTAAFAKSLNAGGSVAWSRGDIELARARFEESLELYRELSDVLRVADLLNNLGNIALDAGDADGARSMLEEALASYRAGEDRLGTSAALSNLALIALRAGEMVRARGLYEESLAIDKVHEDSWGMATSLHGLAVICCRTGEHDEARSHVEASLAHRIEMGDEGGIAECLEAIGEMALSTGDPERALRLWGAAWAIREAAGAPMPSADRAPLDALIAKAAGIVGEDGRLRCWNEGRLWSTTEAVNFASSA